MRILNSLMAAAGLALLSFASPAAFADGNTVAPAPSEAQLSEVIPVWQPEDGDAIRFKVLRKGRPFGAHTVSFAATGETDFTVTNEVELTAKFGPITAYKYRHDSVETWKDGKFVGLSSATRKDGADLVATASLVDDQLSVSGTNFNGTYPSDIVPASHWNVAQLYSNTMLSTEGGQPLDVVIENLGRETLEINGASIETTKIKLESDLTVFLWYDDQGRWLKLDFTARGQLIEYVLEDLY